MKLQFWYTEGGVKKYMYIKPYETGITFNYSEFQYKSSSVYYGWKDIISPGFGAFYGQQGDSWIEQYQAGSLASVFQFDGSNSMRLSTDDRFYDTSPATYNSGKMLHFGTVGTCRFSWTTVTEYTPDPVSYIVNGGIFSVSPTGNSPYYGSCYPSAAASGHGVEYTSDNAPGISFWVAHMYDDVNTGRDEYQKTFDVLVIAMESATYGGSTDRAMFTIIDLRLFDNADAAPITDESTVTPYGRTGTYDFRSDQMSDTSPTGYSIINRWEHGLTLYHINDYQCAAIQKEFWGNETLWGMWLNATVKPIQGVITLHKMPIPIPSGSNSRFLTIFGRRISSGSLLDQIPLIDDQLIRYPDAPDWVPIEEIYGDFFDYAGQSRLSVYLPFIGTIPIDINAVMNGAIMVIYYFDVLTGNCIARVYGRNGMGNNAEVLLYQGSGNAALHIPYCGNDQGGMKMLGSLAGVATAGIAALALGAAATAPAMAALTGTSSTLLAEHNATVNNIPTECSSLSYPYVCYIISCPERVLADYQLRMQGWAAASGKDGTSVSDYTGFLAGYLHADISGATDNEKAEIERYFQSGVII